MTGGGKIELKASRNKAAADASVRIKGAAEQTASAAAAERQVAGALVLGNREKIGSESCYRC
jgi:hypothetical protein